MTRRVQPPRSAARPGPIESALFGDLEAAAHRPGRPTAPPASPASPTPGAPPIIPEVGVAGRASDGEPQVEVRRSARRRRTVSAYRDGERTVVLIPARMSSADEQRWVAAMIERLAGQDRRRRPRDAELLERAVSLSRRHLGGRAMPVSVRWVANQGSRWGSCTPVDRTIRLSSRLQGMPEWVVNYVLIHELAHLIVPGHGPDFWAEVEHYPRTERARGYLEGASAAAGLNLRDDGPDEQTSPERSADHAPSAAHAPSADHAPSAGHAPSADHAPSATTRVAARSPRARRPGG